MGAVGNVIKIEWLDSVKVENQKKFVDVNSVAVPRERNDVGRETGCARIGTGASPWGKVWLISGRHPLI